MTEAPTYFRPNEAAQYIRYSTATLAIWRSNAKGPAYFKVGNSVRYSKEALDSWLSAGEEGRVVIENEAPCHTKKSKMAKRLRGRDGVAQRNRRLTENPLCYDCLHIDGITRPATEIDHIIPLAYGGADEDSNTHSLCKQCHAIRTRDQRPNAEASHRSPSERM